MQIRKRSAAALVVLAAGLAGGQAADTDLAATVDRRVETWQIKPEERPFDAIGWARDIRHARQLAAEHRRPVFLFTLDGRMDVGRCWGGAFALRASSLSSARVIALLNGHFVPVFTANEDYRRDGAAPADERAERDRILAEARKAKLSVGTVHAYVLTPDGRPLDSLHVAEAAKPARLVEMLERAVATLQVKEGKPVVPPTTVSVRPKCEPGSLVLHLTARALGGGDAWGNFPAEDWIVYRPEEVRKLLPADAAKVGTSWVLDAEQTARLLTHFYPATENNDVSKNRLDEQELRATVVSVEKGVARARVEGRLKMQHSFYHKPDGKMVDAEIVGYLDFEPGKPGVKALRLVTEKATYGRGKFGVAVRAVP